MTVPAWVHGRFAGPWLAGLVLTASPAFADDVVAARKAYDQGVEAHQRGDLPGAARAFARADTLSPNAVTLRAALDAAIEADDAALASELGQRSTRDEVPPELAASLAAASLKFRERRTEPPSPAAVPSGATGLPPIVVYGGLAATTVLAGLTTYFAVATTNAHDSFVDAGCDQANGPGCAGHKSDGEQSQQLTNIGFVSTLVVGVATAIVAFGFTNWAGGRSPRTAAGVDAHTFRF